MLTVVGADGNCIKVKGFIVKHFLVGGVVGLDALDAVLFKESRRLAGYKIRSCHDLNIGLVEIRLDVRACYPAAADNADAQLAGCVNAFGGLCGKGVQTVH